MNKEKLLIIASIATVLSCVIVTLWFGLAIAGVL